jgi:hypothetical protein
VEEIRGGVICEGIGGDVSRFEESLGGGDSRRKSGEEILGELRRTEEEEI